MIQSAEGELPVMSENTRSHIFPMKVSYVILAGMVLMPNFF